MKKQNRNILIGLLFILASIILILNPLGYFGNLNIFKLSLAIILVYLLFNNIFRKRIFESVFSLAFLIILFSQELGIDNLKSSTILLSALFLSLGLSLISKNQRRIRIHKKFDFGEEDETNTLGEDRHSEEESKTNYYDEHTGNYIFLDNKFTSSNHYINSKGLKKLEIKSAFGESHIYLDKAQINQSAIIKLKVNFSKLILYVPKDIKLYIDLDSPLSSIQEENKNTGQGEDELLIIGNLSLSRLEIIYV